MSQPKQVPRFVDNRPSDRVSLTVYGSRSSPSQLASCGTRRFNSIFSTVTYRSVVSGQICGGNRAPKAEGPVDLSVLAQRSSSEDGIALTVPGSDRPGSETIEPDVKVSKFQLTIRSTYSQRWKSLLNSTAFECTKPNSRVDGTRRRFNRTQFM